MTQTAHRLARLAIGTAALGALGACAVFRVSARRVVWAITVGVLGVAVPVALAAPTYDTGAFDKPQFQGEMARAPHLFNLARQEWRRNTSLIRDVPRVAAQTAAVYQRLESAGYERWVNPQGCYRVLVISDLHNNLVAVRFALDLAQTFQTQLVLVTGDFTVSRRKCS